MPTRSRATIAASRSSAGHSPNVERQGGTLESRPTRTLLTTVVRWTRLKVWKIMPIRERTRRSVAADAPTTSVPSTMTDPEVAGTRPFKTRSSVDFPAPESPTMTTNSPSSTDRSTPRRASTPPG